MLENEVMFFVQGEPRAQPRGRTFMNKRTGRPTTISADSRHPVWQWRDAIAAKAIQRKPSEPLVGPVRLVLSFIMTRPRGHFKTSNGQLTNMLKANAPFEHTKKPDLDNLEKPIKDVLKECGYYKDDGQVCEVEKKKVYVNDTVGPGCLIHFQPVVPRCSSGSPVLNPFPSSPTQ